LNSIKTVDELLSESWSVARSNPSLSFELAEKAKKMSEELEYFKGKSRAIGNMGAAKVWLSELDVALDYLMDSHGFLQQSNDLEYDAQIVYMISVLFYYLGDYEKQLKYTKEALETADKIGDLNAKATALNGVGTVYYSIGQPETAKKYLYEALKLCEEESILDVLPRVLDGLGQAHFKLDEFEKALEFKERCLAVAEKKGINQVASYALDGIGQVHQKLENYAEALDFFNRAKLVREEMNFSAGVAETTLHIGETYFLAGDNINAQASVKKALEIAKEIQAIDVVYKCHLALSNLYEKMGNLELFSQHFRAYHKYKEDHFSEMSAQKQKSAELETKMAIIEQEKEILNQQNKKLSQYYDSMKLLSELGKSITSSLNLDQVLSKIYEEVNKIMDANVFLIGLYKSDSRELKMEFAIEKGERLPTFLMSVDDESRLAAWSAKNKKEALINDYEADMPKYIEQLAPPPMGERPESIIYLPILNNDELLGVISVQSFKSNAYSDYHLNILRNLAVYASIAIENANNYSRVEKEVKRQTKALRKQKKELESNRDNAKLLNLIGKELISTLDIEEVFHGLHQNVNKLMDANCFGIRLFDAENEQIHYKYEFEKGERLPEATVSMSTQNNYSVWCVQNKKAIHIGDNSIEYTRYVDEVHVVSGDFPYSLLFQPLIKGSEVFGVITVQSFEKNAYTQDHLNMLESLASYTVIALENARIYERLEAKVRERTSEVILQKEIIEEKNRNITDSIRYAKRIQEATLPSSQFFQNYFEDSFILFKPKDIVSGDFYWFEDVVLENGSSKFLFSVVDCTGHGVPGAFMSLIGTHALNQIVKEHKITKPSEILNLLDEIVSSTLYQGSDYQQIKDGMDLAVCSYDEKTQILEYAGAYNPMWIIREGEIIEYKADKIAIGLANNVNADFANHEIKLQEGDEIYIFSDGYVDQFGGVKGKKMKFSKFKELITTKKKSMAEKGLFLDEEFVKWKDDFEQLDDVCVLGIRV
jgi:serine phosphatase RsbU (regulator of sigma subunit)/putative methionine-R-sulfoxide reductase with GAF domain/Tfp pilus assembly protein PilF